MEMLTVTEDRDIELKPGAHIHLVGIGGFGLSAIARVLVDRGFSVSGSDLQASEITADLEKKGINIQIGHSPENVLGADVVLISSAVHRGNSEVFAAIQQRIPVVKRSEFLIPLMMDEKTVAVAGTHGKTTTTSMIARVMMDAGLDPSIIIGGMLPEIGGNGRAGQGEYFLIEADEYDNMFLGLNPYISVITNIDFDHPDLFPSRASYQDAFRNYIAKHQEGSLIIVNSDDKMAEELARDAAGPGVQVESYGLHQGRWKALELRTNQVGGTDFVVQMNGTDLGVARIRVPGSHNVQNALASIAAAHSLGLDLPAINRSLSQFGGVNRRFEIIGEIGSVTVIDDYAHHPAEIQATLHAARQRFPGRSIWAVWQPHTYSRIKHLMSDFKTCFDDADQVVVLEVFKSRETELNGLSGEEISRLIEHPNITYQASIETSAEFILDRVVPGDVLITLTAGDGNKVGVKVLEGLRLRLQNGSSANR